MHSFLIGLQFLTRIRLVRQTAWTAEDFGRSTRFFPLVGLALGLCYAAVAYVLLYFIGAYTLASVLLMLLPLILTGGLHADGLMDTADGVFSGRERARKLEIMKDSRVGAFGVVTVVSMMFVQYALLADMFPLLIVPAVFVMPVIGRLAMVLSIACFPYAREDGLGKIFADMADGRTLLIAVVTTVLIVLPFGMGAWIALAAGVAFAILFCRFITGQLGGVTGDVYGAATVLTETIVLLVFSVISTQQHLVSLSLQTMCLGLEPLWKSL
ncbi:adenosylcobinamide-GDP ribazoletransferase [Selenomonas sp. F0473]|uniref:adenosylcobinamide-GDP ribazoletransferase n=1 Tax=Selenomonas sp. F0473 TaxID=999423 RepID=UPI0025CDF6B0|nr:adenosylcobinamide-GDP ribazoletransferase [Selenomonas sp. F0473]